MTTPADRPPDLGSPLGLPCGLVLPNRIAKAAMTECLADPRTNDPNDRHVRLYRRWADGGPGLSVTGNVMVDRRYLERTTNVVLDERTDRAALTRWAQAAQASGVPALVQVNHPGRQCSVFVTRQPVAPSAVRLRTLGSFATPRPLTDAEVDGLADRYAAVAGMSVAAGFAGVQVHAAHGYLASQFLSPLANRRTDRWGGPLANRARFLLEVVRRTRATIGPSAALAVKLNSADFQRGGFDEDDAAQVAAWLEAEGVDLLEVSGGTYESPALMGIADGLGEGDAEAYFVGFATRVRAEVRMPLMLTGGIRSATVMRRLLAEGTVDMIGLARPLALDPGLPRDLIAGAVQRSPVTAPGSRWAPMDAMVEAGWYGLQMARIADGRDPDPGLPRWRAIAGYLGGEARHAAQRAVPTLP